MDRRPQVGTEFDVARAYNEAWYDRGSKVVKSRRTSLIVDPPDGRIPPLTPQAQKRAAERAEARRLHPADGPEDRALNERCILTGTTGPPMLPGPYNNNYQIVQTPDTILIVTEMVHDIRVVAMNRGSHLPQNIRQWKGDSIGRWEGDTLVVDTTNFTDQTNFRGSGENLHLVERFTRVDADTLLYQFTVDDPESFAKPWTAAMTSTKTEGPILEYACNEGNYGMRNLLSAARAEEKKAAGWQTSETLHGRRDKIGFMAIPNVKRFRPFCPECNESFTLMAVLPKDASVDAYLTDAVARHDHKAFQEAKQQHFKIRVGQQKQKKAK